MMQWPKKFPIIVEENKLDKDKGKYMEPTAFGLPEDMGLNYLPSMKEMKNNKQTTTTNASIPLVPYAATGGVKVK